MIFFFLYDVEGNSNKCRVDYVFILPTLISFEMKKQNYNNFKLISEFEVVRSFRILLNSLLFQLLNE